MKVTVSAPGKVFLLGEHTVVYGKPALLAAIDKRLYVSVEQNRENKTRIVCTEDKALIEKGLDLFKKSFPRETAPPFSVTITSELPTGCGFGSSAAVSAALMGALLKAVKDVWNPQKINELAYELEKITHGTPSGADNSTVVFGGLVWYRKEFDFLKSIWSLPVSAYHMPPFVFIDSGKPIETTKEMVDEVARFRKSHPNKCEMILTDQENQTKEILLALKTKDSLRLKQAIKQGEHNLELLGVVGIYAEKIIRAVEAVGGAAKICGGGGRKKGSGMILCYHEKPEQVTPLVRQFGLEPLPVILGGEGIRLEVGK